jgi:hypothetical protein
LFRHSLLYAFALAKRDEPALAVIELRFLATFLIALSTKTVFTLPDFAGLLTNLPVLELLVALVDFREEVFAIT